MPTIEISKERYDLRKNKELARVIDLMNKRYEELGQELEEKCEFWPPRKPYQRVIT
jgi:hypothetical protein